MCDAVLQFPHGRLASTSRILASKIGRHRSTGGFALADIEYDQLYDAECNDSKSILQFIL
jgi:hypothetical protein